MTTVLISGTLCTKPGNGGEPWVRLSWIRGLQQLGVDVYFIEQLPRESCIDAAGLPADLSRSINLACFQSIIREFQLDGRAALLSCDAGEVWGIDYPDLLDIATSTDLLVNITGHLLDERIKGRIRRKAYIDEDPGYTQIWSVQTPEAMRLVGHDFYFTVGENIGTPSCTIPCGDIPWQPIRQPVVLADWPVTSAGHGCRFTTVGSWRGAYGRIRYNGHTFGQKAHEFRKFITVPSHGPFVFEAALDVHAADSGDIEALRRNGWRLVDPSRVAPNPTSFRRYVQESHAEFSVAQSVYVETGSGWFSDRTVRYLASGKPALVQDTGFRRNYPTGKGLVGFLTLEEAIEGAQDIAANYAEHSQMARQIAEEYFDSDIVLVRLLQRVGISL